VARQAAQALAARAGAQRIDAATLAMWQADGSRTVYCLDVRSAAEYGAGHLPGFGSAPGGQLVQETDAFAAVRGARIVLADGGCDSADSDVRAPMTAHWLAQMGWDVARLDGVPAAAYSETGPWNPVAPGAGPWPGPRIHRYLRPYEGTDAPREAMQAYLDWEFGLVAQLARDGTHGFKVLKADRA